MSKSMTLRLDDEQAQMLELVARADDKTMTEAVRAAIDAHIQERRKDEAFMGRMKARQEREAALYKRLAN